MRSIARHGETHQEHDAMGHKLGILGGSFDPVHEGHLHFARAALDELSLRRVLFIPAATPPHNLSRKLVSTTHRVNMLERALSHHEQFILDRSELDRGGISFTWQTLTALRDAHEEAEFFFIIGSDTLAELTTWARLDTIARLVTFAVARRRTGLCPTAFTNGLDRALKGTPLKTVALRADPLTISSTEIRQRIANGRPWEQFVPPAVAKYIRDESLYL